MNHVKISKIAKPLAAGYFVISFDTELAWGTRDHQGWKRYGRHYDMVRAIVAELLRLLEKYELSATWDLVGHLFLDSCQPLNGIKHPEVITPTPHWFFDDPCTDWKRDPLWYGPDIVKAILKCPVAQEIGSHTFSHMEAWVPKESFQSDLRAWKQAAGRWGIEPVALVFPRNKVGHLDVVSREGFRCYRGLDPALSNRIPSPFDRIIGVLEYFAMLTPSTVLPERCGSLWNIPGTFFYVHKDGWAKYLPISARVIRAKKGLRRAAKRREVFHLWTHPFNLAGDVQGLLKGLESIFCYARDLGVKNATMGQLCHILDGESK